LPTSSHRYFSMFMHFVHHEPVWACFCTLFPSFVYLAILKNSMVASCPASFYIYFIIYVIFHYLVMHFKKNT